MCELLADVWHRCRGVAPGKQLCATFPYLGPFQRAFGHTCRRHLELNSASVGYMHVSCAARPLGCCLATAICSRGPGHHYSLPMAAATPPPHEHHGTGTPSAGYDRVAQTLCALQILRVPHRRQVPCGTDPGPPAVPADGHRSGATGCRQQGAPLFNLLHDATRRCCGVSGRLCPGSYRRKGLKELRGCVWRVGGLVLP